MYQPKTGQKCSCKRGVQRDNCPNCEGTGEIIDFAAIRARTQRKQMFAITHVNADGMRGLTFANQGRNHHETREAAQAYLDAVAPSLREKVLGALADSLEVREVECYAHGDAVGVWFD